MRVVRCSLLLAALAMAAPADAQQSRVVFADGRWAAIDFGGQCEARSKPLYAAKKNDSLPFAGFVFARGSAPQGRFVVHLRQPVRQGSTVIARFGAQPFLLIASGNRAWSRGAGQEQALIAAARNTRRIRIESRTAGGRRLIDRYGLEGAATAIDAAAAECSRVARARPRR